MQNRTKPPVSGDHTSTARNCTVYKSLRKAQTYVFVPAASDIDDLPEALQRLLGELEQVLDVELSPERSLARADANEVLRCIDEQGYFVQMPPGKEELDPFSPAMLAALGLSSESIQ